MSRTHSTSSSSGFHSIIINALEAYEERTKKNIRSHPLAEQLQTCSSPGAILLVLQQQVQEINRPQSGDEILTRWLDPTVNVLFAFTEALGEGVSLVFSPAKTIFVGVGILLSAVRDTRASHGIIVEIFERMEFFFQRLEIYTDVPPTSEMKGIIIKIMVEVFSILAITTKEISRHRMKKYLRKLIGRADIEDALRRLDQLTQEEARMATTQVLKATRSVSDGLRGVDGRVAGVDGRVKVIHGEVAKIVDDGNKALVVMQQAADDVDQAKRIQLRGSVRKWLSPPDPSTNHNIACGTHLKGTATWFLEGSTYQNWKSSSSLLGIYGKPGSGKSVLCSTIIQDIEPVQEAGQASIGYFYFDFQDARKQHRHDLLTSLLFQLSARSVSRCDILSRLYATHDGGARQPTDQELTKCLKKMLTVPDQRPIYLIIDALDECPDTSGIPSPREGVIQLMTELIKLRLLNLHICVTSRPNTDIEDLFEPLTPNPDVEDDAESLTPLRVSLHDESGQRNDIVDYITSVVYSNSERIMRGWGKEEKGLVIETLSKRADGMFQWAFCQLEILRHCLPWAIRHTLEELPESLDETYARILREIKTPNRDSACRLLQCLVAAIRPLRMEELAEVLAIDFDDKGGVPKLKPRWRWEDQEQALLSSCSSLITIITAGESRVVQFSHSSVKEFLTSPRLAIGSQDISRYHILLEPAHTILAQACVSVLLQLDDRVGTYNRSPLAPYAARHWVSHAQFGHVSSRIKGMEYLFDKDRPHFGSWLRLFNIDTKPGAGSIFPMFIVFDKLKAVPLYYAALCGFHDLTKHIIDKHPQHVNARGGYYMTPLVAALAGRHFKTAQLLYDHGADPNVRCFDERTPLHAAVQSGHLKMVRKLVEYNADVNAQNRIGWTPLHVASRIVQPNIEVVQLLLEHGVNVNARAKDGSTALHEASAYGTPGVVRLLLEHGANVEMKNNNGRTPHQTMSGTPRDKASKLKLLKEFSAQGSTAQGPFHDWQTRRWLPMAQGSTTFSSSTQHSQRSGRLTMSSSSGSDTDLNISLPISTNIRSTTRHGQRSGRRTMSMSMSSPESDTDRDSDMSLSILTNNRSTAHSQRSGRRTMDLRLVSNSSESDTDLNSDISLSISTNNRSTTQHGQRSRRRTMYLRHVSSSSVLDRTDQSDTDLSSDISLPISTNSG